MDLTRGYRQTQWMTRILQAALDDLRKEKKQANVWIYLKMDMRFLFPLFFQSNTSSKTMFPFHLIYSIYIQIISNLHFSRMVVMSSPIFFRYPPCCAAPELGFEGVVWGDFAHLFLRLLELGRLNLRKQLEVFTTGYLWIPRVNCPMTFWTITMFEWENSLWMVMFNSYVKLPEGMLWGCKIPHGNSYPKWSLKWRVPGLQASHVGAYVNRYLVGGWKNLSEKYESQVGWLFAYSQYMEKKKWCSKPPTRS